MFFKNVIVDPLDTVDTDLISVVQGDNKIADRLCHKKR
jgi:hypothetical protein